jgi:hypothetical protein
MTNRSRKGVSFSSATCHADKGWINFGPDHVGRTWLMIREAQPNIQFVPKESRIIRKPRKMGARS